MERMDAGHQQNDKTLKLVFFGGYMVGWLVYFAIAF